jgi:DNA segregation ATPase FtsK/SpoIIIE-like protein
LKRQVESKEKPKNKKESELVTKESLCAVCALFSAVALLILFTRTLIFGIIGGAIHSFLVGVLGYFAYPVMLGVLYLSVTQLMEKRFVKNRKAGVFIALTVFCIAFIIHTATTYSWDLDGYISACYFAGANFPKATVTGWLGGIFVFLMVKLTTRVGTIVIFSALALFFGYLTYVTLKKNVAKNENVPAQKNEPVEIPLITPVEREVVSAKPYTPVQETTPLQPTPNAFTGYEPALAQQPAVSLDESVMGKANENGAFSPFGSPQNMQTPQTEYMASREFLFGSTPAELYQKNRIFDPNSRANQRSVEPQSAYTPSYLDSYQNAVNESVEPNRPVASGAYNSYDEKEEIKPMRAMEEVAPEPPAYAPYEPTVERVESEKEEPTERNTDREFRSLFTADNPNIFGNDDESRRFAAETFGRNTEDTDMQGRDREVSNLFLEEETTRDRRGLFDDEAENDPYTLRDDFTRTAREMPEEPILEDRGRGLDESIFEEQRVMQPEPVIAPVAEPTPPPPKPRVILPYVRVPLDDFDCRDVEPTANQMEVEETKANIIATLEDFKVSGATIASVTFGPTVTRYNVAIPRTIQPRKVVALDQSIAISLHSSGVNIYPNYEDGVVSIEVPNKDRQFVQLGCMLTGDTFVNAKSSSLMFTMGKDVGNRKVYGDISKMIHLLVAGSSGSGKSVFLGSLIISLIYKYSPEELRLILIDPKKTEFVLYNDLPHLMINEIITDVNKAVQSLNWAIGEMNRRYGLFEQMSRAGTYVVNLDQYNEHLEKSERLPKIVIIIDELADLMLAAKKDIEDRIQNLTQKARAAGIHLIVATQRPSTDVITGVIKSNLPTRIAFAVATDVDSRVILDQTGAQKLLGKGDFLYTMQGINTPVRVQSAFISSEDSQRVVNFIKANNEAYYDESATAYINNTRNSADGNDSLGGNDEVEAVYIEALRYVIITGSASISMIQRKCSVGYNKAGKIVEWMEDMGYISSFDGAKARKVLITKEEFESKYGTL